MQDNTNLITDMLRPEAVLVAYKRMRNCYHPGGDYYLESRKVHSDGTVGPPKPVSRRLMTAIARTFSKEYAEIPFGAVPERMIYMDPRPDRQVYVWWSGPERRTLTFSKTVPLEDGEYNQPAVVYVVDFGRLKVFAYEGDGRPRPDTPLVRGPFFNYYEDGAVCLGTARYSPPPVLSYANIILTWENVFWNSQNSHFISNPFAEKDFAAAFAKARTEPFDLSACKPFNLTLNDVLKKYL